MGSDAEETLSTEDRIYAVATDLFYRYGYHGTTIRMISDGVGVKPPSIYYHVGSKQELLFKMMSSTLEQITDAVEEAIADASAPRSRLEAAIAAHIAFHATQQEEVFITDSEIRALEAPYRDKVLAIRRGYEQIYRRLVADCLDERAENSDAVFLRSYAILSMCTGVAQWYRPGGRCSLDQIAQQYTAFIMRGLGDTTEK